MCSRACSGCSTSGVGPSLLSHYGGGSTDCGCGVSAAGPGTITTCLRTVLASNYNSSLCECSVQCPLGSSRPMKRRHRLDYAPAYVATNWWKSGNHGVAQCIDGPIEASEEETIVDNIQNRKEVITRPVPTKDILRRVEALLAALPE